MSAEPSHSAEAHPLLQGASPRTVGDWLPPELRRRFVRDYEAALDRARTELDLEGVHGVVEHWRQIAVLQTDPTAFRRTMRLAAEMATGTPSPEDEAWETTLTKAGMQVYVVDDTAVSAVVSELPRDLLVGFAELRVALEVGPWSVGAPPVPANPSGLRRVAFGVRGRAQLVFGVIERDRLVSLLQLSWL